MNLELSEIVLRQPFKIVLTPLPSAIKETLAPSDSTKVHYRVAPEVRKQDTISAQGVFVATCLIQVDGDGFIVSSPMFKHRIYHKKSDGSRPDYRPFEAAPRKEGHDSWEYVASVKPTTLTLLLFEEEDVDLNSLYQYTSTPEGFLKAQNAGLNASGFDFDTTIVSLGFLKNQVDPTSFKEEMNQRLNQLGACNGLYEVMFWGFASEVLTSSSESTESLFVNTNSFSMGVRPYRIANKKNGISTSNRGFQQGQEFASRLVQRAQIRRGEEPTGPKDPVEHQVEKLATQLKSLSLEQ